MYMFPGAESWSEMRKTRVADSVSPTHKGTVQHGPFISKITVTVFECYDMSDKR